MRACRTTGVFGAGHTRLTAAPGRPDWRRSDPEARPRGVDQGSKRKDRALISSYRTTLVAGPGHRPVEQGLPSSRCRPGPAAHRRGSQEGGGSSAASAGWKCLATRSEGSLANRPGRRELRVTAPAPADGLGRREIRSTAPGGTAGVSETAEGIRARRVRVAGLARAESAPGRTDPGMRAPQLEQKEHSPRRFGPKCIRSRARDRGRGPPAAGRPEQRATRPSPRSRGERPGP